MPTNWKALLEIVRQRTPDVWRIAGGPENPTHYTISSFHETRGYQIHSMQWVKERWPDTYESMKPTYIKDAAAIVVAVNHFEEAVATAMATEAEIEKRQSRITILEAEVERLRNQLRDARKAVLS